MASKGKVLEMLDRAMKEEEHIIAGWGYAINEWLPKSDLTQEQKNQLERIVDVQIKQSFEHKKLFNNLFNKVSESDKNEF